MIEKTDDYLKLNDSTMATGSHNDIEPYKIIDCRFDQYEIKVQLTNTNEFIGIIEVKINKEFLSYQQKIKSQGHIDLNEEYLE